MHTYGDLNIKSERTEILKREEFFSYKAMHTYGHLNIKSERIEILKRKEFFSYFSSICEYVSLPIFVYLL